MEKLKLYKILRASKDVLVVQIYVYIQMNERYQIFFSPVKTGASKIGEGPTFNWRE